MVEIFRHAAVRQRCQIPLRRRYAILSVVDDVSSTAVSVGFDMTLWVLENFRLFACEIVWHM